MAPHGRPFHRLATFTFAAMQLQNFIAGRCIAGSGKQAVLVDASTGELVATTSVHSGDAKAMGKEKSS